MRPTRSSAKYSRFLPLCLLFVLFFHSSQGRRQHGCPSTSCGNVSISYPFRLRGDQSSACSTGPLPQYELVCEANNNATVFYDPHGNKYYVKDISYDAKTVRLVDADFASGDCRLPRRNDSPVDMFTMFDNPISWVAFLSCSRDQINGSDASYIPLPCLSTNDTNIVYAIFGYRDAGLIYLAPSCHFTAIARAEYTSPYGTLILDMTTFLLEYMVQIHCIVRFILAPVVVLVFLAYNVWRSYMPIDLVDKFLQNQGNLSPSRYSYLQVVRMTGNFRDKLGQGGFGSVFKGRLPGGHFVAVKMLASKSSSSCNGEDFINEVSTVGRIHHLNIVRLVGFCSEGAKRALIYEYMPNGSLDKYIFSPNGTTVNYRYFTMEKLNQIALAVAKGIDYLHRGCDMRILHFDIKPHNILLDHEFVPKVSDFGLAKLYPKDYSLVSESATRGTIGYIAPELVSRSFGVISYKSDVYSFGMLLMEMAGGRRNVNWDWRYVRSRSMAWKGSSVRWGCGAFR